MLDLLIDHIEQRTLFARVSELLQSKGNSVSAADRELLLALQSASDHILEDIMLAADEISIVLKRDRVSHRIDRESLTDNPPQFQQLDLEIDRRDLPHAIDALESLGYRNPLSCAGAGWAAYTYTHDQLLLTHVDAATTRVRIRWQAPVKGLSRLAMRADAIPLYNWPQRLWLPALALDCLRRASGRLGNAGGDSALSELGEWLGTPESLLGRLVDFAGIGADDLVVDLGCGDGRLLIHAASTTGCTALGVEREADLCARARQAVDDAGLGARVKVVHGDAASLDLEGVSCVFLFLPIHKLDSLMAAIRPKLPPGVRIIAHEHTPYRGVYPPDEKRLLVGTRGFTVGYLWRLPG